MQLSVFPRRFSNNLTKDRAEIAAGEAAARGDPEDRLVRFDQFLRRHGNAIANQIVHGMVLKYWAKLRKHSRSQTPACAAIWRMLTGMA